MGGSGKGKYEKLLNIKAEALLEIKDGTSAFCVAPDMGGRIFASAGGLTMHRIDLENAANPDKPFNNFGGGNIWPAPEGGRFGFNYRGDEWYVQEGINNRPFEVLSYDGVSALIEKKVKLLNRAGTVVEVRMKRKVTPGARPALFDGCGLRTCLTYVTEDSFEVLNRVSVDEGLIAAWTLEQFDADENTFSFCLVDAPENAINFDFYEHPGERIAYYKKGFGYRTDGMKKGQIGIKRQANPLAIGFFDLERKILCIRQNLTSAKDGLYFNIADNEQKDGPFSAADTYSIFNSGPDARFFELETIGCADVRQERLLGSNLVSLTSFAVFEKKEEIEKWLMRKASPGTTL